MTEPAPTPYDELPYHSVANSWTHPDHLATLARLFGLRAPPVEACRVLELGCADGSNLLPLAVALPRCELVGLDSSAHQIAAGQAVVDALGLRNVALLPRDIRAPGSDLGQFDYIVAHGVYSWVPPEAQEQILRLCQRHLAPNGVAFISYNTYPGWHRSGAVREMLRYHVDHRGRNGDLRARGAQGRAFLDFLADAVQTLSGRFSTNVDVATYSQLLKREQDAIRDRSDSYFVHEYLEDENAPLYFHEFVARAAQHGLQFLAEAEFNAMQLGNYPAPIVEAVRRISTSRLEAEQYLDFLRNRSFRQTLLCHADVRLVAEPDPAAIAELAAASAAVPLSPTTPTSPAAPASPAASASPAPTAPTSPAAPASPAAPGLQSSDAERFRGPRGTVLTVRNPVCQAALHELGERWPQALPFAELLARACARLGPRAALRDPAHDARVLCEMLLHCYGVDLVELHVRPPEFTLQVSERPVACPLARYQAQRGPAVTNRRHETVQAEHEAAVHVLRVLDGSRDRAALLDELARLVDAGVLTMPARHARARRRHLAAALDHALEQLARAALLVA